MAQRYKFSIESKNFPLDISGEPFLLVSDRFYYTPKVVLKPHERPCHPISRKNLFLFIRSILKNFS